MRGTTYLRRLRLASDVGGARLRAKGSRTTNVVIPRPQILPPLLTETTRYDRFRSNSSMKSRQASPCQREGETRAISEWRVASRSGCPFKEWVDATGRQFESGLVLQVNINPVKHLAWRGCCVLGSPTYSSPTIPTRQTWRFARAPHPEVTPPGEARAIDDLDVSVYTWMDPQEERQASCPRRTRAATPNRSTPIGAGGADARCICFPTHL